MFFRGTKKWVFLSLFFVASVLFAEEPYRGKVLIMGWYFVAEDTATQTNTAVDAIITYAEAAKYQMNSEKFNVSGNIELYRVYRDNNYDDGDFFEYPRVFVYINTEIVDATIRDPNMLFFISGDYLDRYIEIDFYIVYGGIPSKYKLVLSYPSYHWIKHNEGNDWYELMESGDDAYNFFIAEIEKLKK